jgi:hypothetical protein
MADTVKIPVKIAYDGRGWDQLDRDAKKAERAALAATRQQIQAQRSLQRLTASLDKSIGPAAPSFEQRVGGAVRGQLIGLASIAAAKEMAQTTVATTVELVKLSDQARVTERAFTGLSGGTVQATANLAAMQEATRGLISEQQQQAIANQLLGMQIVKTDEDLERVVSVSRRLGKEFRGIGAAEAADNFALLISNMSYQRLDTFGISSGNVRKRVNELAEAAGRAANQQDFFQATMEEADKVLARLGPEIETTTDKASRLGAKWTDLKTTFGDTITSIGDTSGALDILAGALDGVNTGLQDFNKASQALDLVEEKATQKLDPGLKKLYDTTNALQMVLAPQTYIMEQLATYFGTAAVNSDNLARAYDELAQSADNGTGAAEDNTAAVEDNSKAQEEAAKRLEHVRDVQFDAVRRMQQDLARAKQEEEQTWQKWSDDVSELNSSTFEQILKDQEASTKKQKQIQRDLNRDLAKIDSDLTRDLASLRTDRDRQISRRQEDDARKERQATRQSNIDALGDERLFQNELKWLGAEGDAIGIQQALERRAIEKQIADEKSQEQATADEENRQIEIRRLRDDTAERAAELRDRAAERKAELETQAVEESNLEQQRLDEQVMAENEAYDQRLNDIRQFRDDKLAELENSRQDAIITLAEELAQAKDLTGSELAAIAKAAGKLGEDAGTNFAYGLAGGIKSVEAIRTLLDIPAATPAQMGAAALGNVPSFANGGVVPGPIGQPRLIVAHGGEPVGAAAGGRVTVNVNGVGADVLAEILERRVSQGIDEYDQYLAERLN